jgi:hypothetical protein
MSAARPRWNQWRSDPVAYFWCHVDKNGVNGCWIWTGSRTRAGYGRIGQVYAHRRAWELTRGTIVDGEWVLHRCDNPPCVNPDHLFLGTQLDNMRDAAQKERVSGQRLTAAQVLEMRALWAAGGLRRCDIADRFGVTRTQVTNILDRKQWAFI